MTNPADIVDACEMAEMSPPPPPPAGGGDAALRFVEVAELAALLHLGDYVHARHLWRRHRPAPGGSDPADKTTGGGSGATEESSDPELRQLARLWAAAKSMIGDEPAAAYAALDGCTSSGLEPLATYAGEVRGSYRVRCVRRMGKAYDRMKTESCRAWFGYGDGEDGTMIEELKRRGWSVEETAGEGGGDAKLLVTPPLDWEPEEVEEDEMDAKEDAEAGRGDYGERIKSLTEIVSFMERKRLNY